jgi:hypothetical protein
MSIETRARDAAAAVERRVAPIEVPAPREVVRRVQRRRHLARVALVPATVVALLGTGLLVARGGDNRRVEVTGTPKISLPDGARTVGNWTMLPKPAAGLGEGTSFDTIATNAESVLVGGATPAGDGLQAALWRSENGIDWTPAEYPAQPGQVMAVATDGDDALVLGTDGTTNGATTFAWSSNDGGRSWHELAIDVATLGPAAHHMGRPAVTQLLYVDGWWVGAGAASDGYAAVWVSRDGTTWEQTLASHDGGSVALARSGDGQLHAYGQSTVHHASDPTDWSGPEPMTLPRDTYLQSIAPDGSFAVAWSHIRHDDPTPLVRASDAGETWTEVPSLLTTEPKAWAWTVGRFGDVTMVSGAVNSPTRPAAWVSSDLDQWEPLPQELYVTTGSPPRTLDGGTLGLVAEVDGRIVMLGTAPELDRFYTYEMR